MNEYIKFEVNKFRRVKLDDERTNFTTKEIKNIINKQSYCSICNKKKWLEVDHIIPVVFGGKPTIENSQVLCKYCHRNKSFVDKHIWNCFKNLKYVIKGSNWMYFINEEETKNFYLNNFRRLQDMINKKLIFENNLNFTYDAY